MSATIPNQDELANWLRADSFTTDYRPIIVKEFAKLDGDIVNGEGIRVRALEQQKDKYSKLVSPYDWSGRYNLIAEAVKLKG